MASVEDTVQAYGAAWNEPEEAARRKLLEAAWSDDGAYTDPQSNVQGRDALVALIGGFQKQMPGARIELASGVDQHHDRLRFAWKLVGPNEATMVEGIDYGELAEDGRLSKIVGFWGQPPAL